MMKWLKLNFVPCLGACMIRVLGRTIRWGVHGTDHVDYLYREGQKVIIAFWHEQQFMMPLAYRGSKAHILISQHDDGELIGRIVKRFGFGIVRGSTSRGAVTALRQLLRIGRTGIDVVVTPDGPRGPRRLVQKGVIYLAKTTGLPIVPLTFVCSKKKSFQVGINILFPIHFQKGYFSGENLFGLTVPSMILA